MKSYFSLVLATFIAVSPCSADDLTLLATEKLSTGGGGAADGASEMPMVPLNGGFAAFASLASPEQFQSNPTDAGSPLEGDRVVDQPNIFTKDLTTGEVTYLSHKWYYRCLTWGGRRICSYTRTYPDAGAYSPVISPISPEKRYVVAFESRAALLADSIRLFERAPRQVYMYDPNWAYAQDRIKAISTRSDTPCGSSDDDLSAYLGNGPSGSSSLALWRESGDSGPGKAYVAYTTEATNLAGTDTNGVADILLTKVPYLEDSVPDPKPTPSPGSAPRCFSSIQHTRVTVRSDGAEANGESDQPKISGYTNYIVFRSKAGNLDESRAISPAFESAQIYLYDTAAKNSQLISTAAGAVGDAASSDPQISYQGTKVVYLTRASNIAPVNGTNAGGARVVVYDIKTKRSLQANLSRSGVPSNGEASSASLSPDGRFVVFADTGSNLVADDTNGKADIFIKDLQTGSISRVKGAGGVEANGDSFTPIVNLDGFNAVSGYVTYASAASNLVDGDNAEVRDIFRTFFKVKSERLDKNEPIEVPADASVAGDDVSLTMKKFSGVSAVKAKGVSIRAAKKTSISYEVTVKQDGGATKKLISKQNRTSLRDLKPGTYSVQYRTVAKQGTKKVMQSKLSPAQRIKVS